MLIVSYSAKGLLMLGDQCLDFKANELNKTHIKNCLGLSLGEAEL